MIEKKSSEMKANENVSKETKEKKDECQVGFSHPFFDLFRDDFLPEFKPMSTLMKTDIKDEGNDYRLDVELPGVDKKDIKIGLKDGYLNITATTNKEDSKDVKGKYVHNERFYGSYSRSFYVGDNIKKTDINASLNSGILRVFVPKKAEEEESYIDIK